MSSKNWFITLIIDATVLAGVWVLFHGENVVVHRAIAFWLWLEVVVKIVVFVGIFGSEEVKKKVISSSTKSIEIYRFWSSLFFIAGAVILGWTLLASCLLAADFLYYMARKAAKQEKR